MAEEDVSQMHTQADDYDASQIQVLEGLEAVRKRPGMYIGSTSSQGPPFSVKLSIWYDEALAGFANHITVTIEKDNSITVIVIRGIPTIFKLRLVNQPLKPSLILHAGGKFGGGSYKVSGAAGWCINY